MLSQTVPQWSKQYIAEYYMLAEVSVPASSRLHSTRAVANSWLQPVAEICKAEAWTLVHTFTKHYTLDFAAKDDSRFDKILLEYSTRTLSPAPC